MKHWFIATVIDPASDPKQAGSVKIRIHGHQDNIPDDQLRNAKPGFPVTNPITKKKGGPVTGLLKGSIVYGFFADGDSAQIPVIIGTLGSEGEKDSKGKIDGSKGDTPVATKDKMELGGGDYRLIPAMANRLDGNEGQIDSKSILVYAKDESLNPFEEPDFAIIDDGQQTFSAGQLKDG